MSARKSALMASFIFLSATVPMAGHARDGGAPESVQLKNPDGTVITVRKREDGKIVKTIRQGNKVRVIVEEPPKYPLLKIFKQTN